MRQTSCVAKDLNLKKSREKSVEKVRSNEKKWASFTSGVYRSLNHQVQCAQFRGHKCELLDRLQGVSGQRQRGKFRAIDRVTTVAVRVGRHTRFGHQSAHAVVCNVNYRYFFFCTFRYRLVGIELERQYDKFNAKHPTPRWTGRVV